MVRGRNIHWMAGLLEGEGCFGADAKWGTPIIQLTMTDEDVVKKFAGFFPGGQKIKVRKPNPPRKTAYEYRLVGARAAGLMMTIYPLMGTRRQERILGILREWRKHTQRTRLAA